MKDDIDVWMDALNNDLPLPEMVYSKEIKGYILKSNVIVNKEIVDKKDIDVGTVIDRSSCRKIKEGTGTSTVLGIDFYENQKKRIANNPALRRVYEEKEEAKNTGEFTLREQRLDRAIRDIIEKRRKQSADPNYVLTPEDELDRMLYSNKDLAFEIHVANEYKKHKDMGLI